jgi:hypothetical protein
MNFKARYNSNYEQYAQLRTEAKDYIEQNHSKVTDWSGLFLSPINGNTRDNPNKAKEQYYRPGSITSISNIVRDPGDGDFSFSINGTEWWDVDNETIRGLASYIEEKLSTLQGGWQVDEYGMPTQETIDALFGPQGSPGREDRVRTFINMMAEQAKTGL